LGFVKADNDTDLDLTYYVASLDAFLPNLVT
jgi:hypothetical protein